MNAERGRAGKSVGARVARVAVAVFGVLVRGTNDPFRGPWKHLALQTRLKTAFSGGQVYLFGGPEADNGNSGIHSEFRQCNRNGTNLAVTAGFEISPGPGLLPETF